MNETPHGAPPAFSMAKELRTFFGSYLLVGGNLERMELLEPGGEKSELVTKKISWYF